MVEESRFVWSTVKSVDESATKTNNNISLAAKHINSIHSNGSKSQMSRWPWTICSRSDRMIEVFRIVPVHIWHTQSQSLRGTKYLEENAPLTLNPITLKPLRRIFANFNKWPRLKLPAHYQNFVKIAQGICPCRVIIFQNCFGWVFHTKFNPPPIGAVCCPIMVKKHKTALSNWSNSAMPCNKSLHTVQWGLKIQKQEDKISACIIRLCNHLLFPSFQFSPIKHLPKWQPSKYALNICEA